MSRIAKIPEDRLRDDPGHQPLLDWWAGSYTEVFVALHPFTDAPDDPTLDDYARTAGAGTRTWSEIASDLGGGDFADFALALLLAGYGMDSRSRRPGMTPEPDDGLIARLHALTERQRLSWPWDDSPSPALWPTFAAAFRALGVREVTCWAEFRDASAVLSVDDLAAGAAGSLPFAPYAFQSRAPDLLVTAYYDHIWSLVALSGAARARFDPAEAFEGFWAGPATTGNWVNEPGTYDPPAGWPQ